MYGKFWQEAVNTLIIGEAERMPENFENFERTLGEL